MTYLGCCLLLVSRVWLLTPHYTTVFVFSRGLPRFSFAACVLCSLSCELFKCWLVVASFDCSPGLTNDAIRHF